MNKLLELNDKFENVLEAYGERGGTIYQLENKITSMEKQYGRREFRRLKPTRRAAGLHSAILRQEA